MFFKNVFSWLINSIFTLIIFTFNFERFLLRSSNIGDRCSLLWVNFLILHLLRRRGSSFSLLRSLSLKCLALERLSILNVLTFHFIIIYFFIIQLFKLFFVKSSRLVFWLLLHFWLSRNLLRLERLILASICILCH